MKKRKIICVILMSLFLSALWMSGCAPMNPEVEKILSGTPFPTGWAGIEVAYKGHGVNASHTIVKVDEDSPAFRAGVKVGDEIWFVGPEHAGYINTPTVAKMLRQADPQVVLQIKREGFKDPFSFTITKDETSPVHRQKIPTGSIPRGSSAQAREQSREIKNNVAGISSQRSRLHQQSSNPTKTSVNTTGTSISDPFEIPGVPIRDQNVAGINELKRIYLDPSTGKMVFVGTYNNAYATGTIDYSALLNNAFESPAPSFSLEPTPESKKAIFIFATNFDQQMKRNLSSVEAGKAWLTAIIDLLLSDPTLGDDRQRFFEKGADFLKVKPEEMPEMTQAMLGRYPKTSPVFIKFTSKFYESIGNPQLGFFISAGAKKDVDPGPFMDAIEWMGLEPLRQELMAKVQSGSLTTAQGEALFEIGLWKFNFKKMDIPESRWLNAVKRAESTFNITEFRNLVGEIGADLVREKLFEPWFNGLVFSEQFLHRMYRMPLVETEPVYLEGLVPDSELARTFLEADWTLKTLTGRPELNKKIPGHVTPQQFLFKSETTTGQYNTSGIEFRIWLKPESAPLTFDSSKRILAFQTPAISINVALIKQHGGSPAMAAMTQNGLTDYGKMITQHYDSYAKELPIFHRLREAAKVLAFANWARAQGIHLQPPEPPAAPISLPDKFKQGFWIAHFFSGNSRTFIGLAASGGVDFGTNAGNNWIQANKDSQFGKTAIEQLAGSVALGQEAVDAALKGDLDSARELSDQSALAMTGKYDFTGNPALGKIPEASPPEPVLQVELQTVTLQQTKKAVDILTHAIDERQKEKATQQLEQIRTMISTSSPAPEQIHTWVKLLRNNNWGAFSSSQVSLPAPESQVSALANPPMKNSLEKVTAVEKKRILNEITDLRKDLCRIQSQLRRFNATIQTDQAQREEWEKTVDDAYNSALDRAKDKLSDFSIDFPEGILQDRLDSITDPAERAKLERAFKMVQHLKEAYKLKDFSQWAANKNYSQDEIIAGIKLIAKIIGVDGKIKNYLIKRWGLGRVLAFKDAASDLITSAYDVTAEVLSWQRLAQLNRNSEAFLVAIEKLTQHQREVMDQIYKRELRLGLNPGETKEPCQ